MARCILQSTQLKSLLWWGWCWHVPPLVGPIDCVFGGTGRNNGHQQTVLAKLCMSPSAYICNTNVWRMCSLNWTSTHHHVHLSWRKQTSPKTHIFMPFEARWSDSEYKCGCDEIDCILLYTPQYMCKYNVHARAWPAASCRALNWRACCNGADDEMYPY